MIKNLIFDFGNVLLNLDEHATYSALQQLLAPDLNKHIDTMVFHPFEKGLISEESFFNRLQRRSKTVFPGDLYVIAWNKMLLDFPQKRIDMLIRLRKDYRLFLLSNTNITHLRFVHKKIQLENNIQNFHKELFDFAYFSHEINLRKPEIEIFHYVLQHANILGSESLFIDDKNENVLAAIACGFNAHHHNPVDEIADKIYSLIDHYNLSNH